MSSVCLTNVPYARVIEGVIQTFCRQNGLIITPQDRLHEPSQFPDWDLGRSDDLNGIVMIRVGDYMGRVGLFITPFRHDWPSRDESKGGWAMYPTTPLYIRFRLLNLLNLACIEVGWSSTNQINFKGGSQLPYRTMST